MNALTPEPVSLDLKMLDRLLPMHLDISASGHIRHAGPTLEKLVPGGLAGQRFVDAFELRRPRDPALLPALMREGGRLNLALRGALPTTLKGLVVPLAGGGAMVNLSFGIAVVEAIARHDLTAADFAPTDLTVELLYLVEAKAAVMQESSKLNERLKEAKREAEQQALSDTLTGLGNRRAMDEALARLIARGEAFGLMHLDLDYFKDVNDTLGHAAGDFVLACVAQEMREVTRAEDLVARIGGDEFVMIFRGITDTERLADVGRRLITQLEKPIRWNRRTCRVSGSIGITSTALYLVPDADRMLSDADEALYASKRAGRATVTVAGTRPDTAEIVSA